MNGCRVEDGDESSLFPFKRYNLWIQVARKESLTKNFLTVSAVDPERTTCEGGGFSLVGGFLIRWRESSGIPALAVGWAAR